MIRFTVAIDGKLTRAQQEAINTSIQQAVLPHLATLGGAGGQRPGPDGEGGRPGPRSLAVLQPTEWNGLIARLLSGAEAARDLPKMLELEQQINGG